MDSKKIKLVKSQGNQYRIFLGKYDVEAEAPILWPPDARNRLIEKILMLGKIEGRRRRGQQRMRWFYVITDLMDMSLSKLQEIVRTGKPGAHGVAKSQTQLSN